MNNQKQHWNDLHRQGRLNLYSTKPTNFGEEVLKVMGSGLKILELGCGLGNDSVAFAKKGHTVLATDFSDVVIKKDREMFKNISGLVFDVVDMNDPLDFGDKKFDAVYARLSLHYFTNEITLRIFKNIYKLLNSDGLFCFMCKSIDDPLYGKGEKIEKNMFENEGHIRHFFDEEYVKFLLKSDFVIEKIENDHEDIYGKNSAFVKVIARKVN